VGDRPGGAAGRGRTLLIALVAALTLLSATAVPGGHRVVVGDARSPGKREP
jgi:hypothetical protein